MRSVRAARARGRGARTRGRGFGARRDLQHLANLQLRAINAWVRLCQRFHQNALRLRDLVERIALHNHILFGASLHRVGRGTGDRRHGRGIRRRGLKTRRDGRIRPWRLLRHGRSVRI